MTDMAVEIPFGLTKEELVLDPGAVDSGLGTELQWLERWATPEELPRILLACSLLFEAKAGTIAECLHTAIIWERG